MSRSHPGQDTAGKPPCAFLHGRGHRCMAASGLSTRGACAHRVHARVVIRASSPAAPSGLPTSRTPFAPRVIVMSKPDVKSLCRLPLALVLGLALVGCKSTVSPGSDCKPVAVNKGADGLSLMVSDKVVKSVGPEYFGFNLENSEFQLSLWDA